MGMYRGMVGMGMKCTLKDSPKCMHDKRQMIWEDI